MRTRFTNYDNYSRDEFKNLFRSNHHIQKIDDLEELVSLNDRLTQEDIREVYRPLLQYIDIFIQNATEFAREKSAFLGVTPETTKTPFIIGISGSVAVGKSTVARVLQQLLSQAYENKKVDLITTDGFLYTTAELKRRGLMSRKGFPESYDMVSLIEFMTQAKTSKDPVEYPIYSHESYDVIPDVKGVIHQPDVLIVEGINTFQLPQNQQIYISDFFDFMLYIDADPLEIKQWFTERYYLHMARAKHNPESYFYELSNASDEVLNNYVNEVWYTVNLTNLIQNIQPTRTRADVILHKTENHYFDSVHLRKY